MIKIQYPFHHGQVSLCDENGISVIDTWIPGTRNQFVPPDDVEPVADGMGWQLIDVVSRHKPGRYPERVFYTRQWISPDGKQFGKGRLHIATAQKFNRISKGFGYEFSLQTDAEGES